MRFQHIIEQVYFRPWFITAEGHASMRKVIESHLNNPGGRSDITDLEISDFVVQRQEANVDQNGIGHIHIIGVLASNLAPIEKACGSTDYNDIAAEIELLQRVGAKAILFHINSPGGAASGCTEVAELVAGIPIPTAAIVDEWAASAAYFIAAGAKRIFAPASTWVGSIGCIIPMLNEAALWEKLGIAPDYVTSGNLKATFYGPAMTDDQRSSAQQLVDDSFAQFKGHVTKYRAVSDEAMQGQCFVAPRALAENLIDKVGSAADAEAWLISQVS